jgi:hypothetical protein
MVEFLAALDAVATRLLTPMVSITKCAYTLHSQAWSFCCPYTTAYGRRAWCRMPGKKLEPGRARSGATSHRPISLTSCLCKAVARMVNRRLVWSWRTETFSPGQDVGFGATDLLLTSWWTENTTYKMRFCTPTYHRSSLIWRRLTTPPGGMVFSEPYTAGISGFVYHCFFLCSFGYYIFASGLGMFCLRVVSKRIVYHKDRF